MMVRANDSTIGYIQDYLRNRLGLEKLEKLIFIKRVLSSKFLSIMNVFFFVLNMFKSFSMFITFFFKSKSCVFCNPEMQDDNAKFNGLQIGESDKKRTCTS